MKLVFFKSILILNIAIQCFLSLFRHPYSNSLKLKLRKKLLKSHDVDFCVNRIEFEKINVIVFKNVIITSSTSSLAIELFKVSLSFSGLSGLRFIKVSVSAKGINIVVQQSKVGGAINVSHHDDYLVSNINFKRYYTIFFRIFKRLIKISRKTVKIYGLSATLSISNKEYNVSLKHFTLRKNLFKASFTSTDFVSQNFSVCGLFKEETHSVHITNVNFCNSSGKCILFHSVEFSFQQLSCKISLLNKCSTLIIVINATKGYFKIPQLSSDKVGFSEIQGSIDCNLTQHKFQIEETSFFEYNKFRVYFSMLHEFPENIFRIGIFTDRFTMDEFFQSFSSFKYIPLYMLKFKGQVTSLDFILFMNLNQPWRHIVKLKIQENLKLLSQGDWPDLSLNFVHKVTDKGRLVRNILIDKENEHFTCFQNISPILIQTILFTEDPNFFEHHGIHEKFIGYTIAQNLSERKFARGASTISMQLVRNLFLNHEKTVFRKFEEVLITLLIENVFKLSKTRILELYLNVIEFGPDIYGIKEASKYYFNKQPFLLSPRECLILSYIIPRPKFFMEAFANSSEQLRTNLKKHIEFFSERLLKSGHIDKKQALKMLDPICIRGKILTLEKKN